MLTLSCSRLTCPPSCGAVAAATNESSEGANWSGRPRRLLAPAPPADPDVRDYRIRLLRSRLRCKGIPNPLSVKVAFTQTRARSLAVFPFDGSAIRHSASLHWLPRATVRQLHRYYWSAPTSHRPSRPAPFRSLGRYHGLLLVVRQRGVAVDRLLVGTARRCLDPLPSTPTRGDDGISQVPRQPLSRTCSALRPRRTACIRPGCDARDVAFRAADDVGSAFSHLSRLNHTACSLAVYASQLGLLRIEHHARLASRWRPTLAGQDSHLLGCFRRFPLCASTHIVSSSSWLFLAHQPTCRARAVRAARGGSAAEPADRRLWQLVRAVRAG